MITSAVTLRKLHHVVVLARTQSFARAAEQLNLSKSALSRSIQATEAELGLQLFKRGKRGVFSTQAGVPIITAATTLLESAAEFDRSLRRREADVTEVSFGMGPVPASILLAPAIKHAIRRGDMRVNAQVMPAVQLLERLTAGKIAFFVCALGLTPHVEHVITEVLGSYEVVARVRRGHPLADKGLVSAEAFRAYPQVGTAMALDDVSADHVDARRHPSVAVNDYRLAVETLKETDATCLFPRAFPQSGLVDLSCEMGVHPVSAQFGLCYIRGATLPPATVALMTYIGALAEGLANGRSGHVAHSD